MNPDLLRVSAPLARDAAPRLCHAGLGCSWYHGPWQYFRLLGAVSAANVHEEALAARLREAAREGCRRVLVSGSTDYAMMALVVDAWHAEGALLDLTVTDICPTPLYLCDWYARETGARVTTVAADIRSLVADAPFDLVCTHSFLGNFDADGRAQVARRWHALLRPGGRVITVQRIRPDCADEPVRFSAAQAAAFVAKVRQGAADAALPGIDAGTLEEAAREFAARFALHPIRSRQAFESTFTANGFRLDRVDYRGGTAAPGAGATGGPSVPDSSEFAHLVAIRP